MVQAPFRRRKRPCLCPAACFCRRQVARRPRHGRFRVDQAALGWFLDSEFAKGLRGKSLGGQDGAAFKAAKVEMAKHKVSEGDFVKKRIKAIGHSADVSGVDQAALKWFLDVDAILPSVCPSKPRHGPPIRDSPPSTWENTSVVVMNI